LEGAIDRKEEVETIQGLPRRHPVVGMIGARQVGKTTLARLLIKKTKTPSSYFDLENPEEILMWKRVIKERGRLSEIHGCEKKKRRSGKRGARQYYHLP
jgi:predicted AAA+ superfamily ATPase